MSIRLFLPLDAAARAVGADDVAAALAAITAPDGTAVPVTRTGSRGLFWLEPLLEAAGPDGLRHGFGPLEPEDLPALLAAGLLVDPARVDHPKALGPVEKIPFLARQQRLSFARCGVVDPLSLDDYRRTGGLTGLEQALRLTPDAIVETVIHSGLRGRGGAGFPTGFKWRTVLHAPGTRKYIVCNADEGDSGTFADRILMEGDPFTLIEGMVIAGLATGAEQGYVYCRSEYPDAIAIFGRAIAVARRAGILGRDVAGSGWRFELEIRTGAGAYVCGEETALLESLEGRRGVVRAKPPLPAHEGLFGQPTVINNVLSLAAIPFILAEGAGAYADFGMGRSRGTLPVQIAGNVARGGLYETAFGPSLGEIVHDIAGGTATGRPVKAAQVGGPLGAWFPPALFDTPLDYEAFHGAGGLLGHGGIVVVDDTADMAELARFAFDFAAHESCGKCTPCRIGTVRGREVIDRILAGDRVEANLALVGDLCETMRFGSLCALGGFTPFPVMSAIRHFPADFRTAARAPEPA